MQFAKPLREAIKRGRIKCTVRVWMSPRVKVGGRYRMEDGHIVVDSIEDYLRPGAWPATKPARRRGAAAG